MERIYKKIAKQHFEDNRQMLFMAGPRQVGKTTMGESLSSSFEQSLYLNWDNEKHRLLLLSGEDAILEKLHLDRVGGKKPLLILDEFHKFPKWKQFLKGFFDIYQHKINIVVTGSAKLDIFQKGGDSLMGRYLLYRIHPLSASELLERPLSDTLIHLPSELPTGALDNLLKMSGYPEPYLKAEIRFYNQWKKLRGHQLFNEDIRALSQVQNINQITTLAQLLKSQAGQMTNFSNLGKALRVSNDTVRRWVNILENFYYSFMVRPWSKNVKRSLIKEPKVYLWDWSLVEDEGARIENMVASHLLKAVHFWTDYGLGEFGLYFLRDKEKREVDFLVVRDQQPWFLVEVKKSMNHSISRNLHYFQQQTCAQHAFQVVYDMPYVDASCFDYTDPVLVPLETFLTQLI